MWINEEIYRTGIKNETVNWSNKNSHESDSNSESTQLPKCIDIGDPPRPTSAKAKVAKIEDSIKQVVVIKCDPVTPIFRPRRPEISEPKKGKIKIEIYI